MKLAVTQARIIDPSQELDTQGDIWVEQGQIAGIGSLPSDFQADQVIDANGAVVAPGFVDLWANLREPGQEYKGTMASELRAAVSSGITRLCCGPDMTPVIDSAAMCNLVMDLAESVQLTKVHPIGALTQGLRGEHLSEMDALKQAGCVAVSHGRRALANRRVLRRCLEYAKTHDLIVFVCPQDAELADQGCVHEGVNGTRFGLAGIPAEAETIAVAETLLLAEAVGARVHFSQVSCALTVELLAAARARGVQASCDVAVHQLLLCEDDVNGFDSNFHLQPPLRTRADRDALRAGVKQGVISAISSQHSPHDSAAKNAPFAAAEPGISSFDTFWPCAAQLVADGLLDEYRLLECLTSGPLQVLGVKGPLLAPGRTADLCLLDFTHQWRATAAGMASLGHNSPFLEQTLTGLVTATMVDGRWVHFATLEK